MVHVTSFYLVTLNSYIINFKNRIEQLVLWLSILVGTTLLIQQDWLWRVNYIIYDTQLRLWERPAPDNIIIIAIDESSLKNIGRWPWSRDKYADLINILTNEKASAVGLDIIFAEPSANNKNNDKKLALAIKKNGRVVLPIITEKTSLNGQLVETLPIPGIAYVAKAMGHAHVELDQDGIARSVYLNGGLGTPHWNHFAHEIVKTAAVDQQVKNVGVKNPLPRSTSAMVWVRDNKMLIPFVGAPGHFNTLSFYQVINGEIPKGIFKDKIVLVGATASGLGDALPTPVSGETHSMPGIEINANIISNLIAGINISVMSIESQIILSLFILLIMIFLYSILTPKWNLISIVLTIFSTLVLSIFLLVIFHLWFPPAAVLVALILSYPLWSWRRLEGTIRYLDQELLQLASEYENVPNNNDIAPEVSLRFLASILPIDGWAVYNVQGSLINAEGSYPQFDQYNKCDDEQWVFDNYYYWLSVGVRPISRVYALAWKEEQLPTKEQRAVLNDFILKVKPSINIKRKYGLKSVDIRIEEVKKATTRMRGLRQFIASSLSQMADGVLITDPLGNIAIANQRAMDYLGFQSELDIQGESLLTIFTQIQIGQKDNWLDIFKDVLLNHKAVNIEARSYYGNDFLIQFVPLDREHREIGGLIINMSDISELKSSERRRSEVLGFLSHDLRTPLVSLIALLEIARTKESNKNILDVFDKAGQYAENTILLAEEFLQLAHAESGEHINFKDADFVFIILNAVDKIWVQSAAKNIEINCKLDIEEAWLNIDPSLIERTVLNILSNAIKYSEENTIITLSLKETDEQFHCCIEDQGFGISEEELEYLFDRYYRVNESKKNAKGVGLGLAFVKAVMEKHLGEISVTSQKGKGSCFCLKLPKSNM